jgi:hypothetical protein
VREGKHFREVKLQGGRLNDTSGHSSQSRALLRLGVSGGNWKLGNQRELRTTSRGPAHCTPEAWPALTGDDGLMEMGTT